MTAGSTNNLVITAFDNLNNIVTSYNGNHLLTLTGPTHSPNGKAPQLSGTAIGNPTSINFEQGVSEENTVLLTAYKAESIVLDVTDGKISSSGHGLSLTVTTAAPHHLSYLQEPTTTLVNAIISPPITLEIRDAYDNACVSNNSAEVVMSLWQVTGKRLVGSVRQLAKNGVVTFNDLRIIKAGTGYNLIARSIPLNPAMSVTFDITAKQ
jgi:hypothetical protein